MAIIGESDLGPLMLYDGVCGLCHGAVRSLLRADSQGRLRFAPLQGETAARLRSQYPEIPPGVDSIVLVEGGRVYQRSAAFIKVARHLALPWRALYVLRVFPAVILDLGYRVVAAVRYQAWGKRDVCELPSPEQRARFLP